MGPNGLDSLSPGGHDAQYSESAAVDHRLTIHEYPILAIASVDHVDIDPQVTSELRRHTDGVQTRQSICAITNDNPGHLGLLVRGRSGWS